MKKLIIFILVTISINAQSWNSAVATSIGNASKIDNYANKDGIHILVKTSSNQIKYYLADVSGTTIRTTTFTSSGDFPNIVGSEDGTKLYATYKDGSNIKTQYSTNAGANWAPLDNIDVSSYPTLNTIDVVHVQGKTHITWATSNNGNQVHYKRYDNQNALGQYKEITDYGSEFGFRSTITANGNYVYVSYNAGNNLSPQINVGAVKIRRKNLTTNQWDNPEQVPLIWPYHNSYSAKSRIERVFVKNNYLYLFYMGSVQESFPTELNVIKKNLSNGTWDSGQTITPLGLGMVTKHPQISQLTNGELFVFYEYNNGSSYYSYSGGQWNNGSVSLSSVFSISKANNDIHTVSTGSSNIELRQYDDNPAKPNTPNSTSYNSHPKLYWSSNNEPDIDDYKVYKNGGYLATTSNTYYVDYSETLYFPGPGHTKTYVSYKIKAVDYSENTSVYSNARSVAVDGGIEKIASDEIEVAEQPTKFDLFSNYPNPFNPSTTINYQITNDGFINLTVYNSLGQKVKTLVNQKQSIGQYSVKFNASDLPSGIYIYNLNVSNGVDIAFSSTKKMILSK